MYSPSQAWAVQIAAVSACWPGSSYDPGTSDRHPDPKAAKRGLTGCSNCTRLLAHEKRRYVMTPDQFEIAVRAVEDFPTKSESCEPRRGRKNKIVGIFGGEPLLSPYFPEYVEILCASVPAKNRGLWTSFDWRIYEHPKWGPALPHVTRLFGRAPRSGEPWADGEGYLNWNMHEEDQHCEHQPLLVAIQDVVKDEKKRWDLIDQCWLNRDWSPAVALDAQNEVKFYFCEVAAAFDRVFDLGTGLPPEPGCWEGDLQMIRDERGVLRPHGKFAQQVLSTCGRCGVALPWKRGRRDRDWKDDVSPSNLIPLQQVGSPMVKRGDVVEFGDEQIAAYDVSNNLEGWVPETYVKRLSRTSTGGKVFEKGLRRKPRWKPGGLIRGRLGKLLREWSQRWAAPRQAPPRPPRSSSS
ncbi:MAG: hypothetical protein ACREQQ_03140 [Candidatus Binatia bacterium]